MLKIFLLEISVSGKTHSHSSFNTCTICVDNYKHWSSFQCWKSWKCQERHIHTPLKTKLVCQKNSFRKSWMWQERHIHIYIQVFPLKTATHVPYVLISKSIDHTLNAENIFWKSWKRQERHIHIPLKKKFVCAKTSFWKSWMCQETNILSYPRLL